MSDVVTAARAAQLVNVAEKTMLRWLKAGKVPGAVHAEPKIGEPRQWAIPISSLEGWRRSPPPAPASPAGEDLAERVAQLEATIATLQRRAPWLFEVTSYAATGEPRGVVEALDMQSPIPHTRPSESALASVQRHSVEKRPYVPPADRQKLPDEWISFNDWCGSHGVNPRAADKEIAKGRMPTPARGEWWDRPQGPTLKAYSLEQHIAASQHAALRWPARFVSCEQCAGGE